MNMVVVALILNRNRLLISKLLTGEDKGKWSLPAGPVNIGETDFDAIKRTVKHHLDIDIFHYHTIAKLHFDLPAGKTTYILIKCSVSDETKALLKRHIPSKYKWIYVFNIPDIAFAPLDETLYKYCPPGFASMSPEKRHLLTGTGGKRGFALMSVEKRKKIAGLGGIRAHALGLAHKFTKAEASRAGKIGGNARKRPRK
jgi:ADP-ribose pyrophosphatase YjhB (NUDIX family)